MSEETFDLASVRRFVCRQAHRALATGSSLAEDVPGLDGVRSQHLEDGWTHLVFDWWDPTVAAEIANSVLEPDAATFLVLGPVSVFDGFAPSDEGGAGVLAVVLPDRPPHLEDPLEDVPEEFR